MAWKTTQETSIGITSVIGQVGEKVNTKIITTGLTLSDNINNT